MTNKEAIKYLIAPFATSTKSYNEYLKQKEAYDLAIKALEERPQGEWKNISMGITYKYQCSLCGRTISTTPMFLADYPFCHCGAKMKGGEECMEEDAKQASIPYTYNAPQHDWKCGYPDNTRGKDD